MINMSDSITYFYKRRSKKMPDELNNPAEKIQQMLGDEKMAEAIKMIVNMLANSSTNNKENNQNTSKTDEYQKQTVQPVAVQPSVPVSSPPQTASINSQADAMLKIQQVYTKLTSNNDPTINLLLALKPHLNSKRAPMIDNAIKVVRISKLPSIIKEIR